MSALEASIFVVDEADVQDEGVEVEVGARRAQPAAQPAQVGIGNLDDAKCFPYSSLRDYRFENVYIFSLSLYLDHHHTPPHEIYIYTNQGSIFRLLE